MQRNLTLCAALALLCGTASAAEPLREKEPRTAADVEEVFAALDRDDDARISRTEADRRPQLKKRFAGIDASGDGYLSREEYHARPSPERFE